MNNTITQIELSAEEEQFAYKTLSKSNPPMSVSDEARIKRFVKQAATAAPWMTKDRGDWEKLPQKIKNKEVLFLSAITQQAEMEDSEILETLQTAAQVFSTKQLYFSHL